jgi:hypothetical protein
MRDLIIVAIAGLAGCGHARNDVDHPAPAAPAVAAAPASSWWEIDEVEDAGVLGGAALRLGGEPAYLVMPTIPAYEVARVTIVGSHVTVTGIGQDEAAELVGDRLDFTRGFGAHRASPARSAELDAIIPAVKAKCDRARLCYRAASAVLGIENREAGEFGPLFRSDACDNIITNFVSDVQEAGKSVPAECSGSASPAAGQLAITGLEPARGDAAGATFVLLRGSGFTSDGPRAAKVYFGSRQGSIVRFANDHELVVQAPGGTAGETVDVLVIFAPGGELLLPHAFTFEAKP